MRVIWSLRSSLMARGVHLTFVPSPASISYMSEDPQTVLFKVRADKAEKGAHYLLVHVEGPSRPVFWALINRGDVEKSTIRHFKPCLGGDLHHMACPRGFQNADILKETAKKIASKEVDCDEEDWHCASVKELDSFYLSILESKKDKAAFIKLKLAFDNHFGILSFGLACFDKLAASLELETGEMPL